jgi:hypothetical protein
MSFGRAARQRRERDLGPRPGSAGSGLVRSPLMRHDRATSPSTRWDVRPLTPHPGFDPDRRSTRLTTDWQLTDANLP